MRPPAGTACRADARGSLATPALVVASLLLLLFLPALRGECFLAWDYVENHLLPFAEGAAPDGRHGLLVDSAVQWHPFDRHLSACAKRAAVATRDPWNRFGNPSVAPTWGSALYPPKLLLARLLSPVQAHNALIALHLLLAGVAMALLVRGFGAGSAGMTLAAVSWALSGPVVVWAELQFGAIAAAHLPLLPHLVRRAFDERALGHAALAGLLLGHLLLGCHLQFALYGILLSVFSLAWFAATSGRGARFALQASAALLLVAPLASAPTLLPALDLARDSERAELGWFEDYTFRHPARRLLLTATFLNPSLFGDPDGSTSFHSFFATNANDFQGYAGTAALALGAGALVAGGGRTGLFRLVGGCALAAALLPPAHAPIYYLVPGGSRMCATRILLLFAFALCALAGLSLERFGRPGPAGRGRRAERVAALLLAAGILLPVAASVGARLLEPRLSAALRAAAAERPDPDGRLAAKAGAILRFYLEPSPRLLLSGAAAAALALALFTPLSRHARLLVPACAAVELFLFAGGLLPHAPAERIYPPLPPFKYLQKNATNARVALDVAGGRMMSDTLKPYGIHDLGGKGPLYPGEVGRLLSRLAGGPVGSNAGLTDFSSPLLPRVGVGFVLSPRDAPPGFPERLERAGDAPPGETRVFRVKGATPLYRVVPRALPVSGPDEAFARMSDPSFDPAREACAEGFALDAGEAAPAPAPPAAIEADLTDPDAVALRVRSEAGGFLVALLHAPPGARAFVDGKETPLRRADGIFLGCALPPGERRVEFRFPSPLSPLPFAAQAAGLLAALALRARGAPRPRDPASAGADCPDPAVRV